jgi:two-component system C4-dicarboxylate transport sensor histidine kinase DctB
LFAFGDDNRLEQVLINLYVNALDAMVDSPNKVLEIKAAAEGERVTIRVRDHGPGIPGDADTQPVHAVLHHEAGGIGLGLGLAISAGIVRDFGGALKVANIPGAGAEFVVELKRAATEPANA